MRTLGRIALLVALWILAWGELTPANVASGVVVTVLLLLAWPPEERDGTVRVHPIGVLRLAWYVVVQLVVSNVQMAAQILRPDADVEGGVVAHRLEYPSEEVVTVMSSIIALSPGTMTVDVEPDSSVIYVHFLLMRDVEASRLALVRLEQLVLHAIVPKSLTGATRD